MFYPSSLLLLTLSLFASSSLSAPTFRKVAISDSNSNSNDTAYPNLGPIDTNSTSPVSVPFNDCLIPAGGTPSAGVVHSVDIFPCERAGLDEPCRLRYGGNYTLTVNFTTYLNSNSPKHTLLARDDTVVPSLKYPYSGQSFNACEYIDCPVTAGIPSLYTYKFNTLLSPFNYLSVNVTQTLEGPSLFCTGFAAQFLEPDYRANPIPSFVDNGSNTTTSSTNDGSAAVPTVSAANFRWSRMRW